MKTITLSILIAFFFLNVLFTNPYACDCGLPEKIDDDKKFAETANKLFERAAFVFSGEVIELRQTTVKFKVFKVWKGKIESEFSMSTGARFISENLVEESSCDYRFKFSEKFLVFAYKTEHNDFQAFDCSLTQILKNAERTTKFLDSKSEENKTLLGFLYSFKHKPPIYTSKTPKT